MELDRNPNEYEAERGLTDSSRRGPQPWYANFYKGATLEHSGGEKERDSGGLGKQKGKESDTPLFLLYLSTSLH